MYSSPVGTRSENFQKNVFQVDFFFEAGEEEGRAVAAVTFCCDLEVFCPVSPPPPAPSRRGDAAGVTFWDGYRLPGCCAASQLLRFGLGACAGGVGNRTEKNNADGFYLQQ